MDSDTDLTNLSVSLPKGQRRFVEAEAGRTGCTTTSEYVRRLIRAAEQAREKELLDQRLLAALDSGPAVEVTPEDWTEIRSELRRRIAARSSAK